MDRSDSGRAAALAASPQSQEPQIIGESAVMQQLFSLINRIAPTDSSVLISGATGTGKELVARSIHSRSPRRHSPFIDINCSAIPDTLIEAELFGHQRGTFTGAHETRRGLFEEASGGTLFLDEVDALNLSAQAKLLRVLQERRVRRVGGRENIPIDVRIISATNKDLQMAVAEGSFRPDLLFRLRVVPLHMPELRERGEDVRLLVEHFLERRGGAGAGGGVAAKRMSEEAMGVMVGYRWPGNVRELENAVEYALAICANEEIGVDDLPPNVTQDSPNEYGALKGYVQSNATLEEVKRQYILAMYERCGRHQIKTAAALGIDRRTLYRKLREYGAITE